VVNRLRAGESIPPAKIVSAVFEAREAERKAKADGKLTYEQRKEAEKKERRTKAYRERREKEREREDARREAERAERDAAASEAADMLRRCLGDELPRFLALMDKAAWWNTVKRALDTDTECASPGADGSAIVKPWMELSFEGQRDELLRGWFGAKPAERIKFLERLRDRGELSIERFEVAREAQLALMTPEEQGAMQS